MFDGRFHGMTGLKFYRMRDFWLAGSASGFCYGKLGLGQFVFTKGKLQGGPLTRDHPYPPDDRMALSSIK